MKKDIKLALALDDYKLNIKETLWAEALAKIPWIKDYKFIREEVRAGPTKNTTILFRYFELKTTEH